MNFDGYLVYVISASAIGIIADIVSSSYGKHGKGIEKYVKLAVTLCVLGCILMPAMKGISFDEVFENNLFLSDAGNAVNEKESLFLLETDAGEKVSQFIFAKTGIKPIKVRIDIELKEEKDSVTLKGAAVVLSSDDKDSAEAVRKAASEVIGTEVDVVYD